MATFSRCARCVVLLLPVASRCSAMARIYMHMRRVAAGRLRHDAAQSTTRDGNSAKHPVRAALKPPSFSLLSIAWISHRWMIRKLSDIAVVMFADMSTHSSLQRATIPNHVSAVRNAGTDAFTCFSLLGSLSDEWL